jgi:chromosome segregation ATPase
MRVSEALRAPVRYQWPLLAAVLALGYWPATDAQQAADPAALQQALNRAQGLLRQLSEQRTRLEVENAAAQVKIAALERDVAREKRERGDLAGELELAARKSRALDARLNDSGERLTKTENRLRDAVTRYRALAAEHRGTLASKAELESQLASVRDTLAAARARNEELYRINAAILEQFKGKTSWASFLQREPLLGLKQVEIENQEQDLRQRNEDQRLAPVASDPGR